MSKQTFTSGQVLTATQMNTLQGNDYNWTVSTKTASYTLAATDAGTRVVMNSASATTITVNTNIFTAGDSVWIHNIGAGTCTITAGTATVNTGNSLALAQWGGGSLYFTSASSAIFFPSGGGASYGVATGGSSSSITVGGISYTLLTFTSDGNLVVSTAGLFDVLLVGGGGGGGSVRGGGGGGGDCLGLNTLCTVYLPAATYAVDVGAGGAGGANDTDLGYASGGSGSAIGSLIQAAGGGGGGGAGSQQTGVDDTQTARAARGRAARSGASSGGAAVDNPGGSYHREALSPRGNQGGLSSVAQENVATNCGGGGGCGGTGGNGSSNTGGAGGAGVDISTFIAGSAYYVSAGGGGYGSSTAGAAGNGGVAGVTSGAGNNGVNYGAGGGGGATTGGNGAAGVVYVRFKV